MDLEQKAIGRIKLASQMPLQHYGKPLICTYSGGKDSDVMLELFIRSGVPFEAHHSHTTVDAPPTVYHIRDKFKKLEGKGIKCTIQKPRMTMWELIPYKMIPPTQIVRYCCKELKENSIKNRMIATGVRWDESNQRKSRDILEAIGATKKDATVVSDEMMLMNDNSNKRRLIERCELKAKTVCNPIIDWRNTDIWDYIRSEKMIYNYLYDRGYSRVGCVGCPMVGKKRRKQFADFPTYERAYKRSFKVMLQKLIDKGKDPRWKNEEEVFDWWMQNGNIPGQMSIENYIN